MPVRRDLAEHKGRALTAELQALHMYRAAGRLEKALEDTLSYYAFPARHWIALRTNSQVERALLNLRQQIRVSSVIEDEKLPLQLVCVHLRRKFERQRGPFRLL